MTNKALANAIANFHSVAEALVGTLASIKDDMDNPDSPVKFIVATMAVCKLADAMVDLTALLTIEPPTSGTKH